ncbi:DegV family protein [Erysipelothrix sp. HDW6C]|uniref:DegV family protein n=1 Tax=Erysipelothrix sp. HDW6C TaxID=2714930 RepID=UPI001407B21D|nr:DegV family protein [Erysipelothrix sp. HDW6C]QIK69922.1 DegV family protein [Erysipelothrix sp. HDW6C]
MKPYTITTEVTADINPTLADELAIKFIPMAFNLDDVPFKHYTDFREMAAKEFYERLSQGQVSTTSQPNPTEYIDYFEPLLKDGSDILHISFTSGLSGSYNSAVIALDMLKEKYPERTIICIDSLCASSGQGLLVYEAQNLQKAGNSIETVAQWVEDTKQKIAHHVIVSDLFHLKRGGRVSGATAAVGSVLAIMPVLRIDEQGKLEVISKVRGKKRAIAYFIDAFQENADAMHAQNLMISHSDNLDEALKLKSAIEQLNPEHTVFINEISPVIGSHTGSGTLTLFYIRK